LLVVVVGSSGCCCCTVVVLVLVVVGVVVVVVFVVAVVVVVVVVAVVVVGIVWLAVVAVVVDCRRSSRRFIYLYLFNDIKFVICSIYSICLIHLIFDWPRDFKCRVLPAFKITGPVIHSVNYINCIH